MVKVGTFIRIIIQGENYALCMLEMSNKEVDEEKNLL